jgi:hypothetical protein
MSDYQIKDMLAQFCVMLNCLNDMTKSMNEMRESIKNVMLTLDEELNKVEPIKERDNDE